MSTEDQNSARVADAPSNNWVNRFLPRAAWPYAQLARWDRPIGWQLLLWPCFWSASLAANVAAGQGAFVWSTYLWHLFLFFAGAVAMRGAGCTYNDLIDEDIDNQVARTRSRPLPSGRVSRKQAWAFLGAQALIGLLVLLQFNLFTIVLGVLSLGIVAIYPFAKRFTDWPQFFLGLAFSWGGLVGWAAQFGNITVATFCLYSAAVAWTIGYDTIYAQQDKDDDALIGVRSTARLFGDQTRQWLIGFYLLMLVLMLIAYALSGMGFLAYASLFCASVLLAWQIVVLDIRNADQCLALFKFNSRVGLIIFLGLLAAIPFR